MARVWNASPADTSPAKAHRFLKNIWFDASADTEKQIQDSIFQVIQIIFFPTPLLTEEDPHYIAFQKTEPSFDHLSQNGEYKKYFLSIDVDYVSKTFKPLAPKSWGYCPKVWSPSFRS